MRLFTHVLGLPLLPTASLLRMMDQAVAFSFSVVSDGSSCTFMGKQFEIGATITGFETRCGSSTDFPCFCDPSQDPPISCPYCSFSLPDEGLLCLYEGDTETFTDVDEELRTCTCTLDTDGRPAPSCDARPGLTVSQTSTTIDQANTNDTCTLDLPDGGSRTFSRGEPIGDLLPNRCGDDFPCYCNPDAPNSMECPYCRFPTQDEELLCAGDGETVSFVDLEGQEQVCSCDVSSDPTMDPVSTCDSGAATTGGSYNDDDNDDDTNGSSSNNGICTVELESGQVVTLSAGESYGDYIETRCGSSAEFPCFCNPELKNQMECPYCGFVQAGGDLLCAKHQEVISFNDGEIDQTCTCEIPSDPNQEPIQNCVEGDVPPPTSTPPGYDDNENETTGCTITDLDGNIVTISHGDSFGDLVEGVCGDPNVWPAYCNTQLDGSVTSRAGSQDFDTIEYPYCTYSDTMDGETTCARNNEQVVYVNTFGEEVQCSCSFSPSGLGGAQSTCEPVSGSTSNPPAMTPLPNASAMCSAGVWKTIVPIAVLSLSWSTLW